MKRFSAVAAILALLCLGSLAQAVTIETVPVGDPGNQPDTEVMVTDHTTGYGSVGYVYRMGKYEVTAGQYTAFLNAVASTDTYGLYNTNMSSISHGSGITRIGASGSYAYSVATDFINRPINWVSWADSGRFANWLHNGQPSGPQNALTTENGAYYLNGATTDEALLAVMRKADWKWAIAGENEWYKAAYYKGGSIIAGYWDYPTGSDTAPGWDMADASGDNANYYSPAWPYPIDSGKFTTVTGEFQNSDSPYGTFDQGGNIWEWNEGIVSATYRIMRGGAFNSVGDSLCSSSRSGLLPSHETSYSGFRVAQAVPEPSSLMVLAGGVGMILGLRRRRV